MPIATGNMFATSSLYILCAIIIKTGLMRFPPKESTYFTGSYKLLGDLSKE
jgi:hypothetical protein